jgi:hypothetical protein
MAVVEKRYVNIPAVVVSETFDDKYKSIWPKKLTAALAAAIKGSSKLTTEESDDKKAQAFYAAGDLTFSKTDKEVAAQISVILADWPSKKMFRTEISKAAAPVSNPAKIDKRLEVLMKDLMESIQGKVVKTLESKVK